MTREYKCGICHEPGHNRNTCTAVVSQVKHCSRCGGGGHNVRTCTVTVKVDVTCGDRQGQKVKEKSSPVAPRKCCSYCDKPGHNVRTCEKKKEEEERLKVVVRVCSGCGKEGHNVRTCEQLFSREKKADAAHPVKPVNTKKVEVAGRRDGSNTGKTEQRRNYSTSSVASVKLDKTLDNYLQVLLENQTRKGLGDKVNLKSLKQWKKTEGKKTGEKQTAKAVPVKVPCSKCKQDGHNAATCVALEEPKKAAKKTKDTGYTWLLKKAQLLLETGPLTINKLEGPGHIYIYEVAGTTEEDGKEVTYKIGRSIHLPERRVKAQGAANKEDYVIVKTFETPWNQLTERVIHFHLDEMGRRRIKAEGDGRTEWFAGKKAELVEIVTKVLREVRGMWE